MDLIRCYATESRDQVLLAVARTDRIGATRHAQLIDWLTRDEQRRAVSFAFPRHRLEYTLAHALARAVLAGWLGGDPMSVPIRVGRYGKPYIDAPAAPCFSLSHGGDAVVCAVSPRAPIGVDIESRRAPQTFEAIRLAACTAGEQRRLQGLPPTQAADTALRWWVVKESVLKADGRGLGVDPRMLCSADDPGPDAALPHATGLLRTSDPTLAECHGAVARVWDTHWIAWSLLGQAPPERVRWVEWTGAAAYAPLEPVSMWHFRLPSAARATAGCRDPR
jgi:4'-phosphopantetheinyl transferase